MAIPTAGQVTGVANTLLDQAGLRRSVHGIEQCGSVLFSQLYEALMGARPPRPRGGCGSEAERCQAVVEALSEQLSPHVSLDHIRGGDLAAREPLTIINLLDIFSVLFHLPVAKSRSQPAYTDRDDDNLISLEGLSIISEVLQEELSSAHCHDHLSSQSYSTDSTAELLRPVPRAHLPLLPHSSQSHSSHTPPSLTITSLTCSTITEQPSSAEATAFEDGDTLVSAGVARSGGPPDAEMGIEAREAPHSSPPPCTPPPFTPPPSHKQLLSSPLHHSTPRATAAKSRVFPVRPASFPLAMATTAVPPPSSPAHPLPAAADTDSEMGSGSEGGEGGSCHVAEAPPTVRGSSVASQTEEAADPTGPPREPVAESSSTSVSIPDQRNTMEPESDHARTVPEPESPPREMRPPEAQVRFSSPPTHGSPPGSGQGDTEERRLNEVREEVLASLYQHYLKELQTTRTKPARRCPAAAARGKPQKKHSVPRRSGVSKAALTRHTRVKDEEEEEWREHDSEDDRQPHPPPDKVGVTSDLFPVVEASLPVCPVTKETIHRLWQKQLRQVTTLTKPTPSHPHHDDPHHDDQLSEVERNHTALLGAIKKEIDHTRRMQQQKEAKAQQQAVRTQLQAKRQVAARARRYFTEYELRLKAKLQRSRTREEQIFRKVLEEGLDIVRERERELGRFAREKKDRRREQQRQRLEALEQYYRDQFSMLAESLVQEREGAAVRDKAQSQLAERLQRELRGRLEREVRQLQDGLDREEDVAHFRELDAEQLRLALHHLPFTRSH